MEQVSFQAAWRVILALIATLLSIWLRVSTALSALPVATVARWIIGAPIGAEALGAKSAWVSFANAWFMPRHLIPRTEPAIRQMTPAAEGAGIAES